MEDSKSTYQLIAGCSAIAHELAFLGTFSKARHSVKTFVKLVGNAVQRTIIGELDVAPCVLRGDLSIVSDTVPFTFDTLDRTRSFGWPAGT